MRRLANRLSYANIISTIALVVALGGVSYAAVTLPRNSVGTVQLKNGAVTSLKVKDHSLLAKDFKAGQLPCTAIGATACPGRGQVVTVTHGPVTATTVSVGATPAVGDVRLFGTTVAVVGTAVTGRLDATLTTTARDFPSPTDEVRIGHLVFSLGTGTDQIVIDGTSVYPGAGSTIPAATSTTRPVIGGSGAYAGARGWAETFHLADGTWRHVLYLLN